MRDASFDRVTPDLFNVHKSVMKSMILVAAQQQF
jgi:hypothetical protein